MTVPKTIIFLGDGMADEPIEQLGGRTPLSAATTPAMDSIAADGLNGRLRTLPEGLPTSSEVANMSVLGCDLPAEYCGRGPLEAAARNIELSSDSVAFRLNLTTMEDGILRDYSGGHVKRPDAEELISTLNSAFGSEYVRFYAGVSYRSILVLSGTEYSHEVKTEKPDDHQGDRMEDFLPRAFSAAGERTAEFLCKIMTEATGVLEGAGINKKLKAAGRPPVNGVWPWSGGKIGALRQLHEKYGIKGAVISAVDVINGLGRCLGMDVIRVPGATGYVDTDYEGKADAALKALEKYDFVYLHLEAIDEVSHEQNLEAKLKAIEDFDSRIVARVLSSAGRDLRAAVLPDHPVPLATGKHTREPVPVAVRVPGNKPDSVRCLDETSCRKGDLGEMTNGDLMRLLFGPKTA
ncbi:MAG: cofactor-independent phosphoglycerate mutase [Kiritimatiellia bacterium]